MLILTLNMFADNLATPAILLPRPAARGVEERFQGRGTGRDDPYTAFETDKKYSQP